MGSVEIKTFHKIVLFELKMIYKVCLYISYFYLYMFTRAYFLDQVTALQIVSTNSSKSIFPSLLISAEEKI
jgi:hypothetical protein